MIVIILDSLHNIILFSLCRILSYTWSLNLKRYLSRLNLNPQKFIIIVLLLHNIFGSCTECCFSQQSPYVSRNTVLWGVKYPSHLKMLILNLKNIILLGYGSWMLTSWIWRVHAAPMTILTLPYVGLYTSIM